VFFQAAIYQASAWAITIGHRVRICTEPGGCSPRRERTPDTEAALKLERNDRPFYLAPAEKRASASVQIPARAWVKSATSAADDVRDRDRWAQDPRNVSAPGAATKSAARVEPGRDRRGEVHHASSFERRERAERMGLFLAGALVAVFAWGALGGTAPRSAAAIIAMVAGVFMVGALIGAFGRWRNPAIRSVIDVTPCRARRHAGVALPRARQFEGARDATNTARPLHCANVASPGLGTSPKSRGRSAYDGLTDE